MVWIQVPTVKIQPVSSNIREVSFVVNQLLSTTKNKKMSCFYDISS